MLSEYLSAHMIMNSFDISYARSQTAYSQLLRKIITFKRSFYEGLDFINSFIFMNVINSLLESIYPFLQL